MPALGGWGKEWPSLGYMARAWLDSPQKSHWSHYTQMNGTWIPPGPAPACTLAWPPSPASQSPPLFLIKENCSACKTAPHTELANSKKSKYACIFINNSSHPNTWHCFSSTCAILCLGDAENVFIKATKASTAAWGSMPKLPECGVQMNAPPSFLWTLLPVPHWPHCVSSAVFTVTQKPGHWCQRVCLDYMEKNESNEVLSHAAKLQPQCLIVSSLLGNQLSWRTTLSTISHLNTLFYSFLRPCILDREVKSVQMKHALYPQSRHRPEQDRPKSGQPKARHNLGRTRVQARLLAAQRRSRGGEGGNRACKFPAAVRWSTLQEVRDEGCRESPKNTVRNTGYPGRMDTTECVFLLHPWFSDGLDSTEHTLSLLHAPPLF